MTIGSRKISLIAFLSILLSLGVVRGYETTDFKAESAVVSNTQFQAPIASKVVYTPAPAPVVSSAKKIEVTENSSKPESNSARNFLYRLFARILPNKV